MKEKYKEEDVKDLVRFVHKNAHQGKDGQWYTKLPGGASGKVTDRLFELFISVADEVSQEAKRQLKELSNQNI